MSGLLLFSFSGWAFAQSGDEATLALAKVRGIKGVKSLVSHLRIVSPKK